MHVIKVFQASGAVNKDFNEVCAVGHEECVRQSCAVWSHLCVCVCVCVCVRERESGVCVCVR